MEAITTHRDFKITKGMSGFNVLTINCFGCSSLEQARHMIDIYIDGNNNPQCFARA